MQAPITAATLLHNENPHTRPRMTVQFKLLRLAALLLLLLSPTLAAAKLPSEGTIANFKQARELLDTDPEQAWSIAKELPRLTPADDVRLDLLSEAALRTQRTKEALNYLRRYEKSTESVGEKFRSRLERAELLVWFAILVAVNLQTAWLSPPVALSAYFLKGVVPEWDLKDIYYGMMQFMVIQLIGLIAIFVFPQIALWVPNYLSGP